VADPENMADPDFKALEPIGGTPVAPAHGIAAMALSFALRYHDINTVQDGALYQQYKLEGKNMTGLHLEMVFETAMQMERHILSAPNRLAELVMDAVIEAVDGQEPDAEPEAEQ
jgi:hypothetical protein